MNTLRRTFRPEFLNRIDEIMVFTPLMESEVKQIVEIQLSRLQKMLADKEVKLELTDDAVEYLARTGYDPTFGARPLKRLINKELTQQIAKMFLSGELKAEQSLLITAGGDGLVFRSTEQINKAKEVPH
jgi:ATP-dependent Clp protease ATP-binding subunit ClpB